MFIRPIMENLSQKIDISSLDGLDLEEIVDLRFDDLAQVLRKGFPRLFDDFWGVLVDDCSYVGMSCCQSHGERAISASNVNHNSGIL